MERDLSVIIDKSTQNQMANIDFVYLINLDQRPTKLIKSFQQIHPYDIYPHRVSAIYGWDFTQDKFNSCTLKFHSRMTYQENSMVFKSPSGWEDKRYALNESFHGVHCVHYTTSAGAIGCALTHLSILQDAYDSGHETIWVLEDDFKITKNPHLLSTYIEKLDQIVGKDGWDLLYTDNLHHLTESPENLPVRPDRPDASNSFEYEKTGSDFFKIGGRWGTYSQVIRRSGMKKILDNLKTNKIFRPYDIEVSYTPNMKIFNLSANIVQRDYDAISDTEQRHF